MAEQRLQKLLADAGVASRRAAEKLIVASRVTVNGQTMATLGSKANKSARIEVDGRSVVQTERRTYLMLHKPPFVISSTTDPEGRKTVVDLVSPENNAMGAPSHRGARLYPVGRLDFDSEGLLLLTDDGRLVDGLLHPSRHVPKVYTIKVRGQPTPAALQRLLEPMRIYGEMGELLYVARAASVELVRKGPANCWLELTLLEGRSHQVKRMCAAIGHPCTRLIRTAFAGLELGALPTGGWRPLTPHEVARLVAWLGPARGSSLQKDRRSRTLRAPMQRQLPGRPKQSAPRGQTKGQKA